MPSPATSTSNRRWPRSGTASVTAPALGAIAIKCALERAGVKPADVDVVQSYENFTGGVLMSLVEHGFFTPEESMDFLKLENLIAPTGKMPLNTHGGQLSHGRTHGMGLLHEAVSQLRGEAGDRRGPAVVAVARLRPPGLHRLCRVDVRTRARARAVAAYEPRGALA